MGRQACLWKTRLQIKPETWKGGADEQIGEPEQEDSGEMATLIQFGGALVSLCVIYEPSDLLPHLRAQVLDLESPHSRIPPFAAWGRRQPAGPAQFLAHFSLLWSPMTG